jgi:hypothetical protein
MNDVHVIDAQCWTLQILTVMFFTVSEKQRLSTPDNSNGTNQHLSNDSAINVTVWSIIQAAAINQETSNRVEEKPWNTK